MAGRNDSRRQPPENRYGVPQITRPTPNITDFVIVERVGIRNDIYAAMLPGTPHPKKATALLVQEKAVQGDNQEKDVTRIYCTSRTGQDAYNAKISYAEGDTSYPVYEREYFLPRIGHAPATKLAALKSLTGVALGGGGTGYLNGGSGQIALTFSGGGGTGATGLAEVVSGVVVAAWLTDGGTDFTSAATIGFDDADGSGATATSLLQPTTCVLTKEVAVPAEDEFASLFLHVTRTYETLPGPEIAELHFDNENATDRTDYRQRVAIGADPSPVSAMKIASVTAATSAVVTLDSPHNQAISSTFPVRIKGVTGSTPAADGDYTATFTGANTFAIPLHTTVAATNNTGYLSFLKDGQVIIESFVKPDEDAGAVTGELVTTAITLPGREMDEVDRDEERALSFTDYRQAVVMGTPSRIGGATYKGQTIEDSSIKPQISAFSMLLTHAVTLPGDPVVVPGFDEEHGALTKIVRTRVTAGTAPDTIGSLYSSSPNYYVINSSVPADNDVVGVLTTELLNTGSDGLNTSISSMGRTDTLRGSEPMPRIFAYITGWSIPNPPFQEIGPFQGVNYTIENHSPASPIYCDVSYSIGKQAASLPSFFTVLSGKSRYFPIDGFTLHDGPGTGSGGVPLNGYALIETAPDSSTQYIEVMDPSDPLPGDYTPGDIAVTDAEEHPLKGGINGLWERRVFFVYKT